MKPSAEKKFSPKFLRGVVIVLCIMLAIVIIGIAYRIIAVRNLRQTTEQQAMLNVAVIKAQAGPPIEEIILPGNVSAWHEATIFARTNGYMVQWIVDIGAKVKKGDLLALISTPEVDAQLRQSAAELKTATANYNLAHTTALRWEHLLESESVSKQDTDEKISNEKATAAIVASTRANLERLHDLVSFERVIAPFDGVIMSRTTDIGKLINSGAGTVPLFNLVQVNHLRVYVKIPEYYSSSIDPHLTVQLYFTEHPGTTYPAKLLNTAKAIDPITRTLLAQFVMDNAEAELLAGSYAEVHFKFPANKNYVRLPANTLIFRAQGMQVAVVDQQSRALLKSITIGRDFGNVVEIIAGITPGESVIISPPDSLVSGEKVHIVGAKPAAKAVKTS